MPIQSNRFKGLQIMGSSDSKEEQAQNKELAGVIVSKYRSKQNSPQQHVTFQPKPLEDSKLNPNHAAAHPNRNNAPIKDSNHMPNTKQTHHNQQIASFQSDNLLDPRQSYPNNMSLEQMSGDDEPIVLGELDPEPENMFFDHWPAQFHQDSQMDVKIRMTEIKPLPEYRQLHRKTTEHTATLSWNYERVQVKQKKQLCLRVTLEEPGGFFLKFLVDETSDVLEGSQEMWDLLCPFRTKEQVTKIGSLQCERTYQAQQEDTVDDRTVDPEKFSAWGEKQPQNREKMKDLLEQQRILKRIEQNIGFDYRQVSKYFTPKNEWVFAARIEEKQNNFKSCLIFSTKSPFANLADPNSLISTVHNDIQNREEIYVEEIKKKRAMFKRLRRNKQNS